MDAACPLCGAPLDPGQEWCLHCGAAARTRLAAPTNWKAPIVTIAVIAALALGVLAAALVDLSGGSHTTAKPVAPVTTTITVAITPTVTGTIPTTTGAVTPGTPTTLTPDTTTPANTGAVIPGTPTTIAPAKTTGGAAAPTATATTPATGTTGESTGSRAASEEALRKAGFLPRTKK